jgi:uncharacterized protein
VTPRPTAAPARPLPPATFVVLAKAPVPGLVKTRLTSAYSEHEAAALAAAALLDSLDAVRAAAALADAADRPLVCALTGDLDHAAAPVALEAGLVGFRRVAQRGQGLGERIAHAHRDAAGDFGATVQIGMDTPQVDPEVLSAAALRVTVADGPDAVLGMAADGGWWLLALRRAADARLVANVPMSTSETGRLTRRALEGAGLRVEAAPVLSDVDEPHDVVLVSARCPETRFAALAGVLGSRPAVAS